MAMSGVITCDDVRRQEVLFTENKDQVEPEGLWAVGCFHPGEPTGRDASPAEQGPGNTGGRGACAGSRGQWSSVEVIGEVECISMGHWDQRPTGADCYTCSLWCTSNGQGGYQVGADAEGHTKDSDSTSHSEAGGLGGPHSAAGRLHQQEAQAGCSQSNGSWASSGASAGQEAERHACTDGTQLGREGALSSAVARGLEPKTKE